MTTASEVLAAIDRLAPFRLAESWDNVGLLLGDGAWPVRRVLVSLDVGDAVIEEAERVGAELLLAHHPLIFKDIDRVNDETRVGRTALRLLAARRAVVAAHTNLDGAAGGLCDMVAGMAGLEDLRPLRAELETKHYKVVVFVPAESVGAVRSAAFDAGAGHIGHYAECSFEVTGSGTFRPGQEARPAVGEVGRRNTVPEVRLELLVPDARLGAVTAAIGRAHPYEQPAIDVYPLHGHLLSAGIGRVGNLPAPLTAAALAAKVKAALGGVPLALAGDPARMVDRVAVVTGGGSGTVELVLESGCQAFITGELKMHETQDLAAAGIAVILGGHYATERMPLNAWAPRLAAELPGVDVRLSEVECDPAQWV
jgi:dinuclear metal center YbgI/SA1388 family protein